MDQYALFPEPASPMQVSLSPTEYRGQVRIRHTWREPGGAWLHDTYDDLSPEEAIDVLEAIVLRVALGSA